MVNFAVIAFSIIAGMVFRRAELIPKDAHKTINTWILYLAMPAVSFKYIPKIQWNSELLFPALSSVIVWAGCWILTDLYCRYKKYNQRSRSTLELASGYSNTSFIGFPLIMAYFSEQDLSIAVVCDQVLFILLSTAGIICAVKGDRTDREGIKTSLIIKDCSHFLLCGLCGGGIVVFFIDLSPAEPFFDKLVATIGPLALFSVGLQLRFNGWQQEIYQVSASLFYKLMLAPALVLITALSLGINGNIARISVFEAAMPAMITAGLISEQFGLNTRLINLIIGTGIIMSLFTTFLWKVILDFVML